jgi:exodeoxyribonuclease V alpha subunit
MDAIHGRVQAVIFAKDGYYILAFEVEGSDPPVKDRIAKARGHLHGVEQIKAGVPIRLQGKWTEHKKYGRQMVIKTWEPWAEGPADVERFLSTCVEGFLDPSIGRAIAKQYGTSAYEALTAGRILEEVTDVRTDWLERAVTGWRRLLTARDLSVLLRNDGISAGLIRDILATFGSDAGEIIRANPYRLMELPGMTFETADGLALNMGIRIDDPRRLGGAILWAIREHSRNGHLYMRRADIPQAVATLAFPGGGAPANGAYDAAVAALGMTNAVQAVPSSGLYLPDLYRYEQDTARMLVESMTPVQLDIDVDAFLTDYEKGNRIELSSAQRDAVRLLLNNRVLVLTGLPGTGKTTVVRAIVKLFETARLNLLLMAPTGIAAKRLANVAGHDASTIHRALKYDGSEWGHHEDNKLVVDAVVVDEMSMVDQELIFRLLSALQRGTVVVFVGDDAQLPSVGPGSVLRELVSCSALPRVRLTQIFRQSERSDIVLNSHRINRGEQLPLHQQTPDSEFRFVPIADEDRIVDLIVEMAAKLKGRNANFQVLSPKYEGIVGVNNLNERLRERLNPDEGQREISWGELKARVGDRLMVVKNDYKKNVYNGDVGKLTAIDHDNLIVRVHDAGIEGSDLVVQFPKESADKLRLAYAVTVHKCQGLEFDTIILPVVRTQGWMLQRNLFYTAITRARKKVWILGEESAVFKAISNDKVLQRNTRLADSILELMRSGVGVGQENDDA